MAVLLRKAVQEVLREHEEELSAAIERVYSLENMATSLYSKQVISYEDYNNFRSLDPNPNHLDPALKARYLLHVALLNIKSNQSKTMQFIKILSSHEVMKSVTYILLKQIGEVERGGFNAVTPVDDDFVIVLEMHLNLLAEVLQDVSYKWEEIGIALNLTKAEREEYRNCNTNSLRLHQILLHWYKQNDTANLKNIKIALESRTVAETKISETFIREFQKKVLAVELPESILTRSQINYSIAVGLNGMQVVLDGKSTILEIRMSSTELNHYLWFKDGQPLCDSLKYSGVRHKMLLIKHACQGVEGEYSCNIKNNETIKKKLIVNFSPEKYNLLKIYSQKPEISKDLWPPVGSSSFMKLALVNEKRPINSIHDDSVRGDMDDILKEKKIELYESLFEKYEEGALILIEGRPGSGKTTLTRKLSIDWATKPNILAGANLVFLVSLRALNSTNRDSLTLFSVMEHFYNSAEELKRVVDIIETTNGKDCCFIVDGLDEYKDRNNSKNLVHKLVNRKYLQNAMVIVASRPIGSVNLRRCEIISKRIEVLGFSKESIFKYIDSYFLENNLDTQKGDELKQYLTTHINLLHMCYLPVHAAMICFIYQQPIEDIPVTETKMYELFTLLTIKRKLESDGLLMEYNTLNDLDGNILESFKKVCKLAFDMTVQSKQTITLSPTLSNSNSDVHSLGLVNIDKTARLLHLKDLYSFLHLTFQEFLASLYINMCSVEEQLEIITRYVDDKEMLNVWKYFCGLHIFDPHNTTWNKIMKSKHSNGIYKIQCAFESQQEKVCDAILSNSEMDNIQFDDHTFLPIDMNALAYICNQTTTPVSGLIFNGCVLNEDVAQIFFDKLKKERLDCITFLSFSINAHSKIQNKQQFQVIRYFIDKCQYLNELCLENNIGQQEVDILTNNITQSRLRYLKIHMPLRKDKIRRSISDKHQLKKFSNTFLSLEELRYAYNELSNETHQRCFIALLESFKCKIRPLHRIPIGVLSNIGIDQFERFPEFFNVTNLVLVNCNLCDSDLLSLISLVHENLKILRLDCNKIECREATIFLQFFEKCQKLTHISLSCNMIIDDGAVNIAYSLTPSLKLLELDLQGNHIGDHGALALAEAAYQLDEKFGLILGNCRISDEICKKILEITEKIEFERGKLFKLPKFFGLSHPGSVQRAMPCFKNLLKLNISGRRISESASTEFIKGLVSHCSFLQTLALSFCNTLNPKALFDYSHVFSNLTSLNLSGNRLNEDNFLYLENFNSFTNLKELDLSQNNLQDDGVECAVHYFRYVKIEVLNLSGNNIGLKGAVAIARWLRIGKGLLKFETDDISSEDFHNADSINYFILTSLNKHVRRYGSGGKLLPLGKHQWHDSLQELDLSNNCISCEGAAALGYGLKCCHKLQSLNLKSNDIGCGVEVLLEGLKYCPILSLNLDNNHFSLFTQKLWELSRSIQQLSLNNIIVIDKMKKPEVLLQGLNNYRNLKVLNLENAKMEPEEVKELCEGLKFVAELEILRIGGNGWNCEKIMEEIKTNLNLRTLNFQKNVIDSLFLNHLAEYMRYCQIIDLNLGQTDLHKVHVGASLLSEGLKHCSMMELLDLSFNELDSGDIKLLSNGIQNCKCLVVLNLSNNNFDSDGASYLAEGINCFSNLKTINLNYNNISSDGAVVLMKSLKNCIKMKNLWIRNNCIGPQGAAAIADWINCTSLKWPRYKSCLLTELNLNGNQIETDGAIAIAKTLQFCTTLVLLSMSDNEIGPEAADPLAMGLQNCTELHSLYLENNILGKYGVTLLANSPKYCHSLQHCYLRQKVK